MKKPIVIVLIIVLLGVFLFSAWQVIDILVEYRQGEKTYESLANYIAIPETSKETATKKTDQDAQIPETQPEEVISPFPEVDFAALKSINEDVVGWIYIPDTQINYPIVQGENNDEYLYHLLTGEYNGSGSIFLDAKVNSDFSTRNSPIYGHNMKNGTMFAELKGYKTQEFYDAHPTAMLLTPEKNYFVHLFSAYVTDSWGEAWEKDFTDEAFQTWLKDTKEKSKFTSDVIPTVEDKVLTFSTCIYDIADGRLVVHGILEEYNKTPAD